MYLYQEWRKIEDEIQRLNSYCELEKVKLKSLEEQITKKKSELEEAKERLRKAENNDTFQGIDAIIKDREEELNRLESKMAVVEGDYKKLLELSKQISGINAILSEYGTELTDYGALTKLMEEDISATAKREDLVKLSKKIKSIINEINRKQYEIEGQIDNLTTEIVELENKKKLLESNQFVFEQAFTDAKAFIQKELRKQGIDTEVRFFVELISEITDRKWRKAIETFLGNKRFNIIVDGKYCDKVLQIINENPSLKSKVVITDKLPESEVKTDSAATLLVISNVYARKYANYLLNGIHLCESVEELHEYPLGGLMPNGMLAKSYASSKMDMSRIKLFIGQDAIKQQLEETKKEIAEKQELVESLNKKLTTVKQQLAKLDVDWNVENYAFEAPEELVKGKEKKITIAAEIMKYKSDPGFMAVLEERETAKQEEKRVEEELEKLQEDIGGAKQQIKTLVDGAKEKSEEAERQQKAFEAEAKLLPAFRQSAIEEYESAIQKQRGGQAISQRTVADWEKQKKDAADDLTKLHFDYCRINGSDTLFVGVSFIQHYRDEYRNLANVRIEEAQARLEEQSHKLQSAFASDFVAELDAAIRDAKEEIDKINRELRQLPFGSDTYCFKMEERPERKLFFDICRRMHDYLNNAEFYLNSIKDDEVAERELQDFLDIILSEEDESEYTDYRKYFTYDMKITSKQGDAVVTADYSNKQGSASNGEKQTPYFIILAASLALPIRISKKTIQPMKFKN